MSRLSTQLTSSTDGNATSPATTVSISKRRVPSATSGRYNPMLNAAALMVSANIAASVASRPIEA